MILPAQLAILAGWLITGSLLFLLASGMAAVAKLIDKPEASPRPAPDAFVHYKIRDRLDHMVAEQEADTIIPGSMTAADVRSYAMVSR
jgi:hypothetical protein